MGDTSWKCQERVVATYFGVTRGKRGSDFSEENCEVVATIEEWEAAMPPASFLFRKNPYNEKSFTHIVVECKYRRASIIHPFMRNMTKRTPKGCITLMQWDHYMFSWMEYKDERVFDAVWDRIVLEENDVSHLLSECRIFYIDRKVPKYLDDWFLQAKGYRDDIENKSANNMVYPLINIRGYRLRGHIMGWDMNEVRREM